MTTAVSIPPGFPLWSPRRGRVFLVTICVTFVACHAGLFIAKEPSWTASAVVAVTSLGIGGLQLRHSLAALRGHRPGAWQWTFLALVVLAGLPVALYGRQCLSGLWFVAASGAILMRGWKATAVVLGGAAAYASGSIIPGGPLLPLLAYSVYVLVIFAACVGTLYWSVRLVQGMDRLSDARGELAAAAVETERLRISRDLHDLLGQSLAAVSLKGDLAIRLLPANPPAALAEVEGITEVARSALRNVRTVAHHQHRLSLEGELDAAARLLEAAGVNVHLEYGRDGLAGPAEDLFAWAVREGTTNVLRHSTAQSCRIKVGHRDGIARLRMVNDGVRTPATERGGLAGLASRAHDLAGVVTAERLRGGRFQLVVDVPREDR